MDTSSPMQHDPSPKPARSGSAHSVFLAKVLVNSGKEFSSSIDYYHSSSSLPKVLLVSRLVTKNGRQVVSHNTNRFRIVDCFHVSDRSKVARNMTMVMHFDQDGKHIQVMVRQWTRESQPTVSLLLDDLTSASRAYKGPLRIEATRATPVSAKLSSKQSSARKRRPRDRLVPDNVRERERLRYAGKFSPGAGSSRNPHTRPEPRGMPLGFGRRMRTAINDEPGPQRSGPFSSFLVGKPPGLKDLAPKSQGRMRGMLPRMGLDSKGSISKSKKVPLISKSASVSPAPRITNLRKRLFPRSSAAEAKEETPKKRRTIEKQFTSMAVHKSPVGKPVPIIEEKERVLEKSTSIIPRPSTATEEVAHPRMVGKNPAGLGDERPNATISVPVVRVEEPASSSESDSDIDPEEEIEPVSKPHEPVSAPNATVVDSDGSSVSNPPEENNVQEGRVALMAPKMPTRGDENRDGYLESSSTGDFTSTGTSEEPILPSPTGDTSGVGSVPQSGYTGAEYGTPGASNTNPGLGVDYISAGDVEVDDPPVDIDLDLNRLVTPTEDKSSESLGVLSPNDFYPQPLPSAGIANLGNTCYLAATLQLFLNDDVFIQQLQDRVSGLTPEMRAQCGMVCALLQLYESRCRGEMLDAESVKTAIGNHKPEFSGYSQQDAQEFITSMTNLISEEIGATLKECPITQNFASLYHSYSICCACHERSSGNTEVMHNIMLKFPSEESDKYLLNNLIAEQFRTEKVEYKCDKCEQKEGAYRTVKLAVAPRALVLNVNRVQFIPPDTHSKITEPVHIPERLRLYADSWREIKDQVGDEFIMNTSIVTSPASDSDTGHLPSSKPGSVPKRPRYSPACSVASDCQEDGEIKEPKSQDENLGKEDSRGTRPVSSGESGGSTESERSNSGSGSDSESPPPPPVAVTTPQAGAQLIKKYNEWVRGDYRGSNEVRYKLKGVVRHIGSTSSSGHYVADICGEDDKWLTYNDALVTDMDKRDWEEVHKNGYLLYYVQYV